MSSLERLDIFPKTYDDFKERTLGGALISIVCCLLALCLFTAEFAQYRAVETVDRLDVDTRTAANSKLSINLDLLLPSLPCDAKIERRPTPSTPLLMLCRALRLLANSSRRRSASSKPMSLDITRRRRAR